MTCPNCNSTNHEEGAIFCHICGTQLKEMAPSMYRAKKSMREKSVDERLSILISNIYTSFKRTNTYAVSYHSYI